MFFTVRSVIIIVIVMSHYLLWPFVFQVRRAYCTAVMPYSPEKQQAFLALRKVVVQRLAIPRGATRELDGHARLVARHLLDQSSVEDVAQLGLGGLPPWLDAAVDRCIVGEPAPAPAAPPPPPPARVCGASTTLHRISPTSIRPSSRLHTYRSRADAYGMWSECTGSSMPNAGLLSGMSSQSLC